MTAASVRLTWGYVNRGLGARANDGGARAIDMGSLRITFASRKKDSKA